MLRFILLNTTLAVLSTYLVVEYFRIFLGKEGKRIVERNIIFSYFIWQAFSLQGFGNMSAGVRLVFSVVSVVIVSFCFKGNFLVRIVFTVIYNAIGLLSELLIGSIFLLIDLPVEPNQNLEHALSTIILLLMIRALERFFSQESMNIFSWQSYVMLLFLSMGSMFFSYHLNLLCNRDGNWTDKVLFLVATILILMIDIAIFSFYIKISENMELKRKNTIYQMEIDLYNEQIKEKESAITNIKKSKHDMKNKLIFLLELLNHKKLSEAQTYIEEMMDIDSLEKCSISHSGNSLIDALINYKYDTARQYAIDFQLSLNIPTHFSLANSDLCVILGNALDNAIEANINPKDFKPYISLKMKYDQGNLVIIIENSFDGIVKRDREGNIISRKQNEIDHGIGTMSIQNAVKKYNGYMNTEIKDRTYKVVIVMYSSEL